MTSGQVLVAFDGSRDAYAALRWAQDEAGRRGAGVRLIYVYEWATSVIPVPAGSSWPDPAVRHEAVAAVGEAVEQARAHRPEVPVEGAVIDGTVVSSLAKLTEDADLMVVGSRGLGGFSGLLAGSVAVGAAIHAHCPVVVTRGTARSGRPVVVGVDPSLDCARMLGFSLDQALSRRVELVAVRAWRPPPVPSRRDADPVGYDQSALEAAEGRLVDRLLQDWSPRYPEVAIGVRLMADTAAHALITASEEAQLIVVGCHGRGGGPGQPLGSVARQLIHHAHCPVAVVRRPA